MMDYDKIYERIVRRGDEILEQRRKKAVKIKQTSYAVSGVCAAAIVGVGVWRITSSKNLTNNSFNENNIVSDIESTTTEALSKTTTVTTNKPVTSKGSETSKKATRITQNQTTVTTANNLDTTPSSQPVLTSKTTRNENTNATTIRTTTSVMVTQIETTTSGTVRVDSNNNNSNNNNSDEPPVNKQFLEIKIDIGIDPDTNENIIKSYYYTNAEISKELLVDMLYERHIEQEYFDKDDKMTKTAIADVEIYSIKNISSIAAVAIKFKGEEKYYFYYDKGYSSESLQGLIDDLSLSSDGLKDSVYIKNQKYTDIDTEKIWAMITERTDIPNDFLYCIEHNIVVVPKVSFSYTSPYISAITGSIGISEKGYISTNVGRNGAYFYIGEEKANEIINYICDNY